MAIPIDKIPETGTFILVYTMPNPYANHWNDTGFSAPRETIVTITKTRKNTTVSTASGTYSSVEEYRKSLRLIRAEIQTIMLDDGKILT